MHLNRPEPPMTLHEDGSPDEELAYVITLTVRDYATLMALVMRFGTGTGEGVSTAVTFRQNLAEAKLMRRSEPR